MMMPFSTLIPGWNSLESVRRVHSELEAAALVFFALLVLVDVLAHFADERQERLFDKIGLCFFGIAVLAEIAAYPYGQRNDVLAEQVIGSLDTKVRQATSNASSALSYSGTALSQARNALATAGKAQDSLEKAEDQAKGAQTAAAGALTIARGAREEANTFEKDIVSAKEQAARAESHLAEALKQAADATAELQRLRAPRSLVTSSQLATQLRAFSGTEYRLRVFQDDESIQFTKVIDEALHEAGWVRKPSPYRLGIMSIQVFGRSREQAIPICLETGVQIHFRSDESVAALNARPFNAQTPILRAAAVLRSVLDTSIDPHDGRNVGDKIILDEGSDDKFPLEICVGKKP